ncbi:MULTISPECIES: glycoside hydrolase family 2 TIM barrel-domain containing protein [unclassified Clostridium]|uniref:glycoside hydrolase family 2 protein n=1 Tax=unclassified Clostridium TaxID=2614128 RepID=UPI0011064D78|nr:MULTISPECIES: glycoside hydrolase family 2 TIM barrel-domain containing protein [unclassified Clostridium]
MQQTIPRPEHPRPDWQRADWLNLNGAWDFTFQPLSAATRACPELTGEITVPFSWSCPLSGVAIDQPGVGWYRKRVVYAPPAGKPRLFLHIGGADYICDVYVNGRFCARHTGGYTPVCCEVTPAWKDGEENEILLRIEDADGADQTRGKQAYGEIRGVWQTVYLEARPESFIGGMRIAADMQGHVTMQGALHLKRAGEYTLRADFGDVRAEKTIHAPVGVLPVEMAFDIENPRLWSPEAPNLYEGTLTLSDGEAQDAVACYFGCRTIGTCPSPSGKYSWITLNGQPVYLNGVLDQAYHEKGHFTYPTNEDMRDEIWRVKRLGLNLMRIHIKPEDPVKLYWADKLGVMVMEDMPCFWGEPTPKARAAYEREQQAVLERDFNHPSIVSWVVFNETWGLFTGQGEEKCYLPETQAWVRARYRWTKRFDPTRLVEDNSPCNNDHVESDINSWHFYRNGYEVVRDHIREVVGQTYAGSAFNYIGGNRQNGAPLMNSECGAVWGVDHSAGDSDLSYQYHYMINEYRLHEAMCGFIFTELHDVTNEFNGYYRIDNTDKDFGYDAFVPGMGLRDLHSPDFVAVDIAPCTRVSCGESVQVPLYGSSFSPAHHGQTMRLSWTLSFDDPVLGRVTLEEGEKELPWPGYGVQDLGTVTFSMPDCDALCVAAFTLLAPDGEVVMRNYTTFDVRSASGQKHPWPGRAVEVPLESATARGFARAYLALENEKLSAGGFGAFIFKVDTAAFAGCTQLEVLFEASARQVLKKDLGTNYTQADDLQYFVQDLGDVRQTNPNSYYMTDEERFPSRVRVYVEGQCIGRCYLPDAPADARGVLTYQSQRNVRRLEDAGSYGYLCRLKVPSRLLPAILEKGEMSVEIRVPSSVHGGLALYGRLAGRYPLGLTVRGW